MLHHVSIGVADVERAAKFYDAVLGALGFKRTAQYLPYAIAYGPSGMSQFWTTWSWKTVASSSMR